MQKFVEQISAKKGDAPAAGRNKHPSDELYIYLPVLLEAALARFRDTFKRSDPKWLENVENASDRKCVTLPAVVRGRQREHTQQQTTQAGPVQEQMDELMALCTESRSEVFVRSATRSEVRTILRGHEHTSAR